MDTLKSMYVKAIATKALAFDKTQQYFATPEHRLNRLLTAVEQMVYIYSH